MLLTDWLMGLFSRASSVLREGRFSAYRRRLKIFHHFHRSMECLESRLLLTSDFGDAPDLGTGTATGDYQTLLGNTGPSHVIDATQTTLFLGARVDGEANATPNADADGDDKTSAPDDEDGLFDPAQELVLTVGTAPVVQMRATNTTGAAATLYGWIDYNRDGTFDNATERASVAVPTGTNKGTVALTFPLIPLNTTAGTTYARFRLSADAAAANSTGAASGGEVEDYVATISQRSNGTVDSSKNKKIANNTSGGPSLVTNDFFGIAVAALGDLDGDGVNDLAVGAYGDDTLGTRRGAVYVEFMNANGTVKSGVKLANTTNGGPALTNYDYFGNAVVSLGDLDGDGVSDIAVGAPGDDTGGSTSGAVHILLLNSNGTAKSTVKIASGTNGGPTLSSGDRFGVSLAVVGDMDGDGVTELAVGAYRDDTNGNDRGAVHILRLNSNGTVKSSVKIADNTAGGPALTNTDHFGSSLASLGDLNGDGVTDLAVGARNDDTGGADRGAVHVLFLNPTGTVKSSTKLTSGANGLPALANNDQFGFSLTSLGDLDGDGVTDLGVGATGDDTGGDQGAYSNRGALHLLLLTTNGTVKSSSKLASGTNGGPTLANKDAFGSSAALLGDLNGDGLPDLAVGAFGDDTGGSYAGAVHVLFLKSSDTAPPTLSSFTRQNPVASKTDADTLVFRATFNEAVVNVDAADFRATGTTAGITSVLLVGGSNGTQYDITVSGGDLANLNGTVGLNFSAAPTIVDLAGNVLPGVEPVIDETYLLDNSAPTLSISPNAISTNVSQITFTFQFNEPVINFNASDISVLGGSKGTFTAVDADTYTLVVSPTADGTITVTVAAGAAQDTSGLSNILTSVSVISDRTAPTLTITPSGTTTNTSQITFTFQFSETVTSFISSDISVTNGTKGTFIAVDGDTYTLIVTPIQDGLVTVSVPANSAQDAAGNGNNLATASVTSNRTAPTLTITPDGTTTNTNQITFTFQFSETVTSFISSDISVTNGTKGTFIAVDGDTYTLIVTPIQDGLVTVSVPANSAQDAAGNGNNLATASVTSDRTAPTLTITPDGTTTNTNLITFTFQFSETVTSFISSDISVTNGTKGTFIAVDGDTYTLIVTPIQDGLVTVSVPANSAQDAAGNGNNLATASVTSDRTAPTLTITPDGTTTNTNLITFTFQFSEIVTSFISSDISVTNGTKGTFIAVDGDTYTLVVTPIQDGLVTVSVPANSAQDAAGNGNNLASASVTSDRTAPTLTITPAGTTTNTSQITFTFQFSETVTSFISSDINVTNGTKGTFIAVDGDTYTLVVTPIQDGLITVSVPANSAQDAVGNGNNVASASVTSDRTAPTLTITPDGSTTNANQITFTFQFSETVTSFISSDISVTNGTKGTFIAVDGDTYTLVVTPIQDGLVTVSVPANAAQDAAGNGNNLVSASVTSDRTALSLTVDSNITITNLSQFTFTFQFSEFVSNFDITDITLTNGTKGVFTVVDGDTYTLVVIPIADGLVTATVAANAAQDSANNGNTFASGSVISDRTAPTLTISPDGITTNLSQITFTFQFSETVTSFTSADITITNASKGTFTAVDGDTYTLVVFTSQNGAITVNVDSVAIDVAANSNLASSATITTNLAPLSLEISPDGVLTNSLFISFLFQFSEVVTDFDVTDIEVINGIASSLSTVDGQSYVLDVFPLSDGNVSVSVIANAAFNSAEVGNSAASALIISDRTGPVFSSTSEVSILENSTIITTVAATDVHGPVTYGIQSGLDSSRFLIDSNSGLLRFASPPDFEFPTNTAADNVYRVHVQAIDTLGQSTVQDVSITVLPVNDNGPVFVSLPNFSIDENTTIVGNLIALDADLPAPLVTYSITGGADAAKFTISSDGSLRFVSPPNFEAPGDGGADNLYHVTITASDNESPTFTTTQDLEIEVVDVDEAPSNITLSTNTVKEQQPVGTVVGTLSTDDPDAGSLFGYTLVSGAGSSGNSRFRIVGSVLQTNAVLNFATQTSYSIRVQSMDSMGLSTEKVFTINVIRDTTKLLDLGVNQVIWTNKTPAVKVLTNLTVTTDVNFEGATLVISIPTVGTKKKALDQLMIPTIQFGTSVDSRTPTQTSITVSLNGDDTAATVQAFLHGITFATSGKGLSIPTRTIRVTLSDAFGHSSTISQVITVRKKAPK